MEKINLPEEIHRIEALYEHYRRLYRRVRFLYCSNQASLLKEHKDYYKNLLQTTREKGN